MFIVDAFSNVPFKGNQAGVCLLREKLEDKILQQIAFEINLSETAFISLVNNKDDFQTENTFNLRWFTPETEVKLCGHATLASTHILFNEMKNTNKTMLFNTLSGILSVSMENGSLVMNFPSNKPTKIDPLPEILRCLSLQQNDVIAWAYNANLSNVLIEVKNEDIVKRIKPNFEDLKKFSSTIKILGVIVTTEMKNSQYDFASRYFAPWKGINEDPVTGGAHTVLVPYWSKKMNKNTLKRFN